LLNGAANDRQQKYGEPNDCKNEQQKKISVRKSIVERDLSDDWTYNTCYVVKQGTQ